MIRIDFFVIALLLLAACNSNLVSRDGGGTETVNAVVVVSNGLNINGYGSEGCVVVLCNDSFNAIYGEGFVDSSIIDSNGTFTMKKLKKEGKYNIIVTDQKTKTGKCVLSVEFLNNKFDSVKYYFDSLGSISGSLFRTNKTRSDTVPAFGLKVSLLGTPQYILTDTSGAFIFKNIPVGSYEIIFSQPVTVNPVEKYTVTVNGSKLNTSVKIVLND